MSQSTIRYRIIRDGAGIVSFHRTRTDAERALTRQQSGAADQGGYSLDYIEELSPDGDWAPIAD